MIRESLFVKGTERIFALLFLTQLLGRMFDFLRCNFSSHKSGAGLAAVPWQRCPYTGLQRGRRAVQGEG